MESTVYANINDRLRTMLAEGYLTQVEYDKTNDALSVDHPEDLVMVYKIQLSLETAKRDIKRNNDI